ncbi:penicillin-binding protein 2 [Helicobacter sp. 12S02232-10]|uniref:penicillin-binding protein 2 n=1 Tax=Helicobacter sp. 12S02232-10 TaxID=1476197 RepID=UPI000BA727FD|nr:penicillin-binding protein 2 [Helicobacter sp. 12S02232-10]PAF47648.1 penicillin-binding protein 2 [Helicobacter sp. 12S02232-10]
MKKLNIRYKIVIFAFILIWMALIAKVFVLTIKSHEYFEKLAQRNMTKKEILIPSRGQILDRNGEPLAINELGFSILFNPLLKDEALETQIETIGSFFPEINRPEMIKAYKKQDSIYNHSPIKVVNFIPYTKMQKIYARIIQNPDILVEPATKRLYPNNLSASHVIGYVGAADEADIQSDPVSKYTGIIGKTGLEKEYNFFLQGQIGYRIMAVNALNQELEVLDELKPENQNDLVLSIDMRLQEIADAAFQDKEGAVIVMDVHTGEIIVAGSYPEYNLNDFVGGISYDKWNALSENIYNPLLNKLVNALYPPGSVVKMGMGLAFLEYAGVNENTKIDTPAYIELGGRKFRDWKPSGHGKSDLVKAIRESVDVYFYKLSQTAGINNIANVLKQMGFGQKTGVDIPNEFIGIVPDPEWKMKRYGRVWYTGDTIITSIGQGAFLVTPMQIAGYTALIATGKLPIPHFAKTFGNENSDYEPKDVLNDFQKSKLSILQKGMYEACSVKGGTAYSRTLGSKAPLACKTGTAQVVQIPQEIKVRMKESQMEYLRRSHAWITGFVPYKNPKYAITVLLEHGQSGGKGGPILVKMANALYDYGYLK